jgi:hypothetical protein
MINTDLYDIYDKKNEWFVDKIEAEIVDFLEAVLGGQARIAVESGRCRVIVPVHDGYIFMKEGRLFSSVKKYDDLKNIKHNPKLSWSKLT